MGGQKNYSVTFLFRLLGKLSNVIYTYI